MDYESFLTHRLNLQEIIFLRDEMMFYEENFRHVFSFTFREPTDLVAWQAAWACEKVSAINAAMFSDKDYWKLIEFTLKNTHNGMQRLCLSILLNLPIRHSIPVEFINLCFEQMISPKSPIAVQVLSMKLLYNISEIEIGFAHELLTILENTDDENYSPAFFAAKKHVLKKLKTKAKHSF